MDRVELRILYQDGNSSKLRCIVNKWKFQDAMMGEQYLTFTITSETPIDWAVGDFCVFRGETYTLNYVPSVTQKAGTKERQDAYTYENVKFESHQEELTRCIMLDITASTGLYIAALGTNYTGSSKFPLYCGETSVGGDTLTPVCALAAKMQANLDRMYGGANAWKIFVDTTTTFVNAVGDTVLVTHTDDKQLSFDNTTVAQALAEVHNTFDLDYCIRGRNIYIGYNLKNLTSDNDEETFAFGYGKGYPTHDDMNKGLFQIKRMANPQQKIVTRLRALGSTKNMPYRYYNKKYNLSQSLFPTNLQLPDTFETSATKATHNAQRDPSLSHVKGDTNDSYIDKNNNAAACAEGIREDCARWDGSNGDLVEIYPTIDGATYGELRGALVEDQDGNTGNGSFPNYSADERIDKLLAVGYKDGSNLVDDANKGDGILPESGISSTGVVRSADIGQTSLTYGRHNQFAYNGGYYAGKDHTLFTIQGVMPGKYAMAPTIGSTFFGFSLSCYRDGCSADVGFQIIIKQKNQQTGVVTTLATYTSDLVSIQRSDGVKEIELPELPDVVNGANAKVSEIRVTAMSDIAVTFRMIMRNVVMPSGFTDDFSISYKVGNSRLDHSVTYEPEYTWFPVDDSDSIVDRFHVFIQDMGFDLQACWSDETPMLVMKSGRCVGREFEILQDIQKVTHNNKKGYMLTLKRAEDSSLNTYYPSQTDPIAADDTFVLLGIQMPEAYVKMAEVRLLRAATQYLADNCETKFTYQPSIDDIYLQRNYDNMVQAGTPNKSIFWRLYAGLKFTFRGVPTSEDSPAPLADITIEKVTISMGEGLTPKVELTLNDDVQQGTIQKLTTSVDRIYNGSIFASGSGNGASGAMSAALLSLLQSEGEKLFLSKTHDDTAAGKITFNDVVTHNETLKAKKGIKVGNFQSRFLGSGALIDEEGNAEFESIYSRNFISTPEFRFNRITVTEGENWCTNGFGTIKEVEIIDDTTGYITLKLEENDYASIETGDICRGIYNDIANQYETASLDDDTELYAGENDGAGYGFSSKEGFFTSYFWVRSFVENKKGECKFMYELRNSNTPHPCAFMKFAQYGSFTNSERRSSSYATSIGHYYEMVLDGVSTWKIKSANVVYRKGYLGNMTVTLKNGHEAELQGYGLYVQDNVYFGNAVVQLDPETIADLQDALNSYTVDFSGYVDVVTVDDVGNVIGGLWTLSGDNDEYRSYRIHSAITVRKSGTPLVIAADDADAGEGTYKIYAQPKGCSCIIENSTIYITGINNIKDGVAGNADDANFDYAAMRAMEGCNVDLIIDCEGKGSIVKNFPVIIKHDSRPFIGADISNEFSGVSWNTQTQAYIGLPITFDFTMWHNDEFLNIENANDVSLSTSTSGVTLVNGAAPATPAASSIYYTKTIETIVKNQGTVNQYSYKVARITITAMGADVPLVTDISVTASAIYSGVTYERTLVHTINKSTDTNVYSLLPSVSEIVLDKNTNSLSVSTLTCSVICDSSDDKHYTVAYADFATHGIIMYYKKFYTNGTSDADETPYTNTAISVGATVAEVRFYLYGRNGNNPDRTIVHDQEGVSVVSSGEDGDDAANYYLTSDINTIVKDKNNAFKGSARPTITAWKKVGDNEAVRLADIVNGNVVAEGMTINAYEMNGNTIAFTNTSTTGVLTCAQPYQDADRFEVELVKNNKTYATMSIPILKEVQGEQGEAGVYPRDRGLFKSGETYYYTNQGGVYIRDMVRYEIGGVLYGFLVKTKDTTVTTAPSSSSGDSYWEATGIVETVIANTIFGTNANIGGFMASAEMLRSVTPAYRVKYMGDFKTVSYGLYYQGTFQLGTTYYYAYHGYSVYGAVFYNGSYYKRVGSSAPDTTKTPAEDTSHWTTFVSADYDCISHPNTEWLIPSGCTYTYSEASVDAPAIRPMVKYSNKYYVAKGSMLGKTFFNQSFSTTNWREAYDFEVIGIQNVNDTVDVPKFMLNGGTGTLIMRQADDTIYTYDEDGKQTTGYENGRKVVIDPATKSVSVFNDNGNQVITINGENKSSISSAYTGNSGNTSVAAGSVSKGASGSGCLVKANEIKVLSNTFTIGDGGWNFQIQASLSVQASFTTSSSWCPDKDKSVLSYIRPITYYEGSYGHQSYCKAELVLVKEGGSTVVLASATQGANGASYSLSIDKNIHISGGTYYLALRYTYALYSNHSLYITHGAISAAWAKDGYMGEIFANGLAFGNNAQNFFAVIKESDTNLHLKLLSNNKYGLEISSSGVKVCINGTWYTVGVSGGNATLT
jgi:hypothetical protein